MEINIFKIVDKKKVLKWVRYPINILFFIFFQIILLFTSVIFNFGQGLEVFAIALISFSFFYMFIIKIYDWLDYYLITGDLEFHDDYLIMKGKRLFFNEIKNIKLEYNGLKSQGIGNILIT